MTVQNTVDEIKAPPCAESGTSQADCANAVEKLARKIGQLPINPTAKLVALTMRVARVTDTKQLSEMLGLSLRVVQRSKNEFADAGDISDTGDTYVANPATPATPTSLSPAPRVHAPAQIELPSEVLPTKVCKKDSPPTPKRPSSELCLQAFHAYNDTALRLAIPQAAKFTPNRQRQISARLNEYGIEGWTQALANLGKSAFLTGKTDHNFRADLDFVLQAKSFGKLHDGGYSNGKDAKPAPVKKVHDQFSERAAREYWAKVDGMIQ
jgi:hypothetical protein